MSDTHDGPETQIVERDPFQGGEIMSSLEASNLDMQITTAKKYPRSIKRSMEQALAMATLSEDIAADCCYAIPRAGKTIEGPSVRLAEIIASAWGNLHAATRVTGENGKSVIAEAVAWDMEKNVRIGAETHRSILDKGNRRFSEDMVRVTGAAAMSIALRNAIFRVVPNAFVQELYRTCKKVAMGEEKTLSARRTEVLTYFQKLGVKPERLFAAMGIAHELDIGLEVLAKLRSVATAIKTGETTIDEAIPDPTGAHEAADKKALPSSGDKAAELTAELKAKKDAAVPVTPEPLAEAKRAKAGKTSSLPGLTAPTEE